MTRAAQTGFNALPPETCRSLLERIRWGLDAETLTFDHATRTPGQLYKLPRFLGTSNIALRWDKPLIGIIPHGDVSPALRWSYTDRTGDGEGLSDPSNHALSENALFEIHSQDYFTTRSLGRFIAQIIQDGSEARWQFYERFKARAHWLTMIASKKVSTEITDGADRNGVIDSIEAEAIVDRYMLGEDGVPPTRWWALLDRASGDLRAGVGDRLSYLEANVESTIDEAVRRKIGDPEKGRTIRNIHRRLGDGSTIQRIQDEYRAHYPNRSGAEEARILAALTVAGTVNSQAFAFHTPELLNVGHGSEDGAD